MLQTCCSLHMATSLPADKQTPLLCENLLLGCATHGANCKQLPALQPPVALEKMLSSIAGKAQPCSELWFSYCLK